MVKQLKNWLQFKYRTRRVGCNDKASGKAVSEYRTSDKKDKDLMFSSSTKGYTTISADNLYSEFRSGFGRTLDLMHKGQREESKFTGGRRLITFHSFRRFVKSTISDLGFGDYSEYFIGHSGSTYYRKTDKAKAELFKKIEPYLTYTDILMLKRKGNDTKTKIDELEAINQILTQRYAMKNEVISKLSNKLTWLTKEVESIKEQRGTRAA